MRQNDTEPAAPKLAGGGMELSVDAVERCLDEDPWRLRWTLRDRGELLSAELTDHPMTHLGTAPNGDGHAFGVEVRTHFERELDKGTHIGPEVVPEMRRGDDRPRTVAHGGSRVLDTLAHVRRAVIDSGKKVKVQLDGPECEERLGTAILSCVLIHCGSELDG
jgi:hypothetical protein